MKQFVSGHGLSFTTTLTLKSVRDCKVLKRPHSDKARAMQCPATPQAPDHHLECVTEVDRKFESDEIVRKMQT
ncbi:hypothetical protein M8J76_007939 [Diaphorina citri]|nr:hypothetical protein M8J76_007939 [Diaphorina citri]